MTIFELIGILISIISASVSWYFSTKKKRLIKSIEDHQDQIKKIQQYSQNTGYKIILKDYFQVLFYALSAILTSTGTYILLMLVLKIELLRIYAKCSYGGFLIGIGIGCYQCYTLLSKASNPKETIPIIEKKLEKLSKEADAI